MVDPDYILLSRDPAVQRQLAVTTILHGRQLRFTANREGNNRKPRRHNARQNQISLLTSRTHLGSVEPVFVHLHTVTEADLQSVGHYGQELRRQS